MVVVVKSSGGAIVTAAFDKVAIHERKAAVTAALPQLDRHRLVCSFALHSLSNSPVVGRL